MSSEVEPSGTIAVSWPERPPPSALHVGAGVGGQRPDRNARFATAPSSLKLMNWPLDVLTDGSPQVGVPVIGSRAAASCRSINPQQRVLHQVLCGGAIVRQLIAQAQQPVARARNQIRQRVIEVR